MVIGLIGAMDEEVAVVKENMEIEEVQHRAGMEFNRGSFRGKDVILVRSGIGKVNAAICTQILIDIYNVDCIINTGIAGGVNVCINPGDIVVSTDLVHHDMDTSYFGEKVGQVPRVDTYSFIADEGLVDIAVNSARDMNDYKVFKGRIISGDQFISSGEKIKYFREQFDAYAVEMEGAAIAHTCYVNKVPFVVIRSISDRADGNVHIDYWEFKNIAIKNSIGILSRMIDNM
jgi:adenosylhomocysteine nucleosidase